MESIINLPWHWILVSVGSMAFTIYLLWQYLTREFDDYGSMSDDWSPRIEPADWNDKIRRTR